MNKTRALILAAGKGSRMKTNIPKVLIELHGKPLVQHVFEALQIHEVNEIGVIVSKETKPGIEANLKANAEFILQENPQGTGHAVICAEEWLSDFCGNLIVVVGDAPSITKEIISDLLKTHKSQNNICTLLSACWDDPPAYGRIVRDRAGKIIKIVEEKDATEAEKRIKELSSSHYCFRYPDLKEALKKIDNNNAQQEFYLPDVISILIEEGKRVEAILVDDPMKTFGINTREELVVISCEQNQES